MRYWLGLAVAVAVGFPAASAQAQAPSPTATQTPPPAATNTPTPAPTATPTTVPVGPGPTIQAIAAPPPTGDFILDRALLAIAGTNPDDVSRQLHFLRVPCNPAHAIPCPSGQTLGASVDGMWVVACQNAFVLAGTAGVTEAERFFLSSRQSLFAVTEQFLPNEAQFEAFYLPGVAVLHDGMGIIGFQYPCGTTRMSDFIAAVVGANPRYVLAPGNPPFAPATGTGPRPADRGDLPLGTVAMVALGIAMAVWGTLRMWLRERVARSGNP